MLSHGMVLNEYEDCLPESEFWRDESFSLYESEESLDNKYVVKRPRSDIQKHQGQVLLEPRKHHVDSASDI
jgi:hypothetical protein